jgi:DNA helicase IV
MENYQGNKRKFTLPGVNELNKDQDRVLRLPEKGKYLVVGGPGTGKSVVALLRALKFHNNKNEYILLTYNRVLESFTKQLVDFELNSCTIKKWFYKLQYNLTNEMMPELEKYKPDYDEVISRLANLDLPEQTTNLIIDEAQDMPPMFYETLICANFTNFFLVADQNQQITEENSSREDLTIFLGIDKKDVIELKQNYRNSQPIALLAQHFYTDVSSPLPKLPPKENRSLDIPILYTYNHIDQCAKTILLEADKDNRKLIGVIMESTQSRQRIFNLLSNFSIELVNQKPQISTYTSEYKQNVNINFDYGGIVVLCDKSVKGLEFDIVYIFIDDFMINNNDLDAIKKRFYVMTSRAREKLILFKSAEYRGDIEAILPEDKNILIREKLKNSDNYLSSYFSNDDEELPF